MSSPALADYLGAFTDKRRPFLTYHFFLPDKSVCRANLSRGEFWSLARKTARVLREQGIGKGQCFAHYLSANRPEDLAFRLGATMVGAVPVTINWQADTLERIALKVQLTESKLVIIDRGVEQKNIDALGSLVPGLAFFPVEQLEAGEELPADDMCSDADLGEEATKIVIFTSGTTGQPKGVRLSYRNYAANQKTFESFLQVSPGDAFAPVVVNPLHHTNSTAIADWAIRRPGSRLHLVERYSTQYWAILAGVAGPGDARVVAPLVSRHFDYLENLRQQKELPVPLDGLRAAMSKVDFLLGSAPVGPTTVKRLVKYAGRLPLVRFGSTETCLQVLGTPLTMSEEQRWAAFRTGWEHKWKDEAQCGYYVGRPHPPYTEVRIVRSVEPDTGDCFVDCDEGEPGCLITRGENVMLGYVKDDESTRKALREDGWYTGFGDVCFWLADKTDGERNYYWLSRESALLIRGGANYAYAQVESELKAFAAKRYELKEDEFDIAVVGLRIESEHDDSCCVTVELLSEAAMRARAEMERTFLQEAAASVTKGACPDHLRFAKVPRNFKGAILVSELKAEYQSAVAAGQDIRYKEKKGRKDPKGS